MSDKKIFYKTTIERKGNMRTYFLYEDGSYCLDWWDKEQIEKNNARWRLNQHDELEFWIESNNFWGKFNWPEDALQEFVAHCSVECLLEGGE